MEPQVKTFMEQSGFTDSELKTKKHDFIVVSLLDEARMKEVIFSAYPEILEGLGYWASDYVVADPEITHRVVEFPTWDIVNGKLTNHEICEAFKCKYPMSSINPAYVQKQISRLHAEAKEFKSLERPAVDVTPMYPVLQGEGNNRALIGYVDFLVTLTYTGTTHFSPFKSSRKNSYDFFVEVRTRIPSVGEVLRQMRTYMEFTKAKPVLVAQVSRRIKKAIELQGIPVYVWDF